MTKYSYNMPTVWARMTKTQRILWWIFRLTFISRIGQRLTLALEEETGGVAARYDDLRYEFRKDPKNEYV